MAVLAGAALAPSLAMASPILLLPTTDAGLEKGVGLSQWTKMTANLSADTGGQIVSSSSALDDLSNLKSYNGLWLDLGSTTSSLTPVEIANLQTYIQTGRRVVMIGGDPVFASWDASLLSAVGSSATTRSFAGASTVQTYIPLTNGVASLDLVASGIAASGTSLFLDRVATVWGPSANALVLLDSDPLADEYLRQAGNNQFASNVASWIAGGLGSTMTWKNSAGGTWSTSSNWTAGLIPSVADAATFNLGHNAAGDYGYTVTLPSSKTAASVNVLADKVTLSIPAGAAMNVSQSITVSPPANQVGTLSLTRASGTGSAMVTAATITLGGNAGSSATLSVNTGVTLTAASAVVAAGSTVQVNGGAFTVTGGLTGAGNFNQSSGASTVGNIRLNALSIGGGTVSIASPQSTDEPATVSVLNTLSIAQAGASFLGTLDLAGNDLIVETGDLDTLTAALAAGYDGGKWDGPGIDSSAAAAADTSRRFALGILQNSDGDGHRLYGADAPLGLFDGQDPAFDAILIKYTLYGDNDLSGSVTAADIASDRLGAGGWSTGDFNFDGRVDAGDLAIQLAALGETSSSVPEPVLLSSVLFGVVSLGRVKRKRPGC